MPKTKIVCTIGPASDSPDLIRQLIKAGMNVARLNFSHGTHEEHQEKMRIIREISKELEEPVAILQDLCGPKIRVGEVKEPGMRLEPGETLTLTSRDVVGENGVVSTSYENLPGEVKPHDLILLADGMMELEVVESKGTEIVCRVITGGRLTSHKGINLPTGTIKAPSLTMKDEEDLLFGLANNVDYVALSFVRKAMDIQVVKDIINRRGKTTPVVAKIEKHEALDEMDAILKEADGIMIARGDLGVEIPLENVPGLQKQLIQKANALGKPVIIATQMLRSMVDAPRPTRAEAADVANGVLDGADAVMLSEETAAGRFPVKAVRFMSKIAEATEANYPHARYMNCLTQTGISESVAYAASVLAEQLNAEAIVATSRSGATALQVSRLRPAAKIIALSPDQQAIRRMALFWGCTPFHLETIDDTDQMIEKAADSALKTGKVHKGDLVVITAGRPVYETGTTNMVWVKRL